MSHRTILSAWRSLSKVRMRLLCYCFLIYRNSAQLPAVLNVSRIHKCMDSKHFPLSPFKMSKNFWCEITHLKCDFSKPVSLILGIQRKEESLFCTVGKFPFYLFVCVILPEKVMEPLINLDFTKLETNRGCFSWMEPSFCHILYFSEFSEIHQYL